MCFPILHFNKTQRGNQKSSAGPLWCVHVKSKKKKKSERDICFFQNHLGLIISAAEHAKFSSSTSMADLEQIYIHNLDFYSLEQVISLDSLICSPFNNMIFVSQVKKIWKIPDNILEMCKFI